MNIVYETLLAIVISFYPIEQKVDDTGNIEPIKHFSIDVANRHPVVCAEVAKKLDNIIMMNDGYKIEVTAHYIIGDIGNSEVKICVFSVKNKQIKKIVLKTPFINESNLKKSFSPTLNLKKINKVLFSSVVPETYKVIENFFLKEKLKIYEVKDAKLQEFINIKVNKKQVGSDRICNAIALNNKKNNFIIIDFGTATTFDVVTKDTYKGGIIAPGIKISLNTLSDKATLIPKINLKKINKVIGVDTNSAVRSGFFWGYAGLIDNIVDLIKKETGKSFKLVITGGFSNLYKSSIKTKVIHNKEITIKGLIKISKLIR